MSTTTTQLRAYITIDTAVMAKGSPEMENLRTQLKGLAADTEGVIKVSTRIHDATEAQAISTRSMLLNFRMFSFAVRTLRRELGVTNPVVQEFSRLLLIASAVGTGIIAIDTLSKGIAQLTGEVGTGLGIVAAWKAALNAGVISVTALSFAIAGLIGFAVGTWFGEQVSPVRQMNIAIKAYKEQVEDLTQSLSALKVEQADLGAESAMYAAAIARVNYEIELQGYATEAQTETLKMLEQASARASMETANFRAETAMLTAEQMTAEFQQSQLERERQEFRQRVLSFGFGRRGEPQGLPFAEGGQANRDIISPRGNRPIEITVDFSGAEFGNGRDVEGAVRRGIYAGISDSGRTLESLRRGE